MVRKKKVANAMSKEPQSEAEYISLGNEFIAWAQQEDSLIIDGFPISKSLSPAAFHALPANSEQFSQAYDIALGIIGSRRERLAHEGLLNAQIVRETMPLYNPMHRKWLISQKNKDENFGETKIVTVHIPTFYDCPDGSHKSEYAKLIEQRDLKKKQEADEAIRGR